MKVIIAIYYLSPTLIFSIYIIMDYTKSATVIQTKFFIRWQNLLKILNNIAPSIPNTEDSRVFILLINKINSNCIAAISLISKNFINEGFMIFRSAIETTIYAKYLKLYPNKQKDLFEKSRAIKTKYQLSVYKDLMRLPRSNETIELQKNIENSIKEFIKNNEILRKKIPQPIINLTDKEIKVLDKFFQKQKLDSQNVYFLLQEIQKIEPQFANTQYNSHDIFYHFYDENSTILHGNLYYWNEQPTLDKYNLLIISSHLIRIITYIEDIIKDKLSPTIRENLKQEIKKLIELESNVDLFSTSFPAPQNSLGPLPNS